MSVGIVGFGGTQSEVDATSRAHRVTLYDAAGNVITKADRATATPGTTQVLPVGGFDYKVNRASRVRSDGSLAVGDDALIMFDPIEGAALNTNIWISTLTTWTVAAVANGVITFNPGNSVAGTTGNVLQSHKYIPRFQRQPIVSRTRARPGTHSNNNLHEIGFGSPASATAATAGDAAFWRKDATGQWLPVLSLNGAEMLGATISNATFIAAVPVTEYCTFETIIYDDRAEFIITTLAGAVVSHQTLDLNASGVGNSDFARDHLQSMIRSYNSAGTGAAVNLLVSAHAVYLLDVGSNKPWAHQLAGAGFNAITHPTTFGQTANWGNNAAPSTRTPSNTAAGEATLGGICSWSNGANSFGVSDTLDLVIFGFQVPTGLTLYITRLDLVSVNLGAAVGATAYTLQWVCAPNLSSVSMASAAPYGPKVISLGMQSLAAAAPVGAVSNVCQNTFQTPIVVQSGRFVDIVARVISGTATASEVIRTMATVEGYFE